TPLCATTSRTLALPPSLCWRRSGSKSRCQRIAAAADGRHSARATWMPPPHSQNRTSIFSPQAGQRFQSFSLSLPAGQCSWKTIELNIARADEIAGRCVLFEKFVDDLLAREPGALPFDN